ncbi:MAG: glmU [Cytophagaceae bacterium]|jgi:bifunctional N-acetylglucosamine-1-phosphate-uridyltransferase/glucosamine-1-phosphate-acetyltransferase GlmU-like protein|nr:glmU [Cytophagaceae bacterium]
MSIALILAAGKGTRMRSLLPKPLVSFHGQPIVSHLINSFKETGISDLFLIVGHEAELIKHVIGNQVNYVDQPEQRGTAHAVEQAKEVIDWKNKNIFVFVGDSPLISADTISWLEEHHKLTQASCTFLTATFPIDLPYARVIKNKEGILTGCVEEKNATPQQLRIRELLSSHFIFKGEDLFSHLDQIKADKDNEEFYLTDIIGILLNKGLRVEALQIDDYQELVGLNTPEDIQWAEQFYKKTKNNESCQH